jgi:hypothetical protein
MTERIESRYEHNEILDTEDVAYRFSVSNDPSIVKRQI